MWDLYLGICVKGDAGECLVAATLGTLSGERCVGAVKQRRFCGILGPPRVAVIGLGTLVATLVAQSLFIRPSKVSVPGQEITRNANRTSAHFLHAVRTGTFTGW
jgi:hypothetical protein